MTYILRGFPFFKKYNLNSGDSTTLNMKLRIVNVVFEFFFKKYIKIIIFYFLKFIFNINISKKFLKNILKFNN
jgi:hypothetical protein